MSEVQALFGGDVAFPFTLLQSSEDPCFCLACGAVLHFLVGIVIE